MFCDIKTLTVEDLVGRLRAAEDRFEDKAEQSLTELVVCYWLKKSGYKSINTVSKQIHTRRMALETMVIGKEICIKNLMVTFLETQVTISQKLTSQGTPRRKGRCRNCGIYGH
jgi:hypothetical protein